MNTPARVVTNLTRWTWAAVFLLALGVVAVAVVLWVSNTVSQRISGVEAQLSSLSTTNRIVFCNTERLLLVRAVQNGYAIPSGAALDVCGLPIIGNPPLPEEGPAQTPGATLAPFTTPTNRPGATSAPTTAPVTPPSPSVSVKPAPTPLVCILTICP